MGLIWQPGIRSSPSPLLSTMPVDAGQSGADADAAVADDPFENGTVSADTRQIFPAGTGIQGRFSDAEVISRCDSRSVPLLIPSSSGTISSPLWFASNRWRDMPLTVLPAFQWQNRPIRTPISTTGSPGRVVRIRPAGATPDGLSDGPGSPAQLYRVVL